jgi:hypothetical protein
VRRYPPFSRAFGFCRIFEKLLLRDGPSTPGGNAPDAVKENSTQDLPNDRYKLHTMHLISHIKLLSLSREREPRIYLPSLSCLLYYVCVTIWPPVQAQSFRPRPGLPRLLTYRPLSIMGVLSSTSVGSCMLTTNRPIWIRLIWKQA